MTRDATQLVSMPIFDITEGRQVGRVKDAIFDPEEHALYGLIVKTDAGMDSFLSRLLIRGLGEDSVTVEGEAAITPLVTAPRARELMESGIRLRGVKVVTETGDSLGTLDKIMLSDDGSVECYEAVSGILGLGRKHEVKPDQVLKIGTDAMIVTADAAREDIKGDQTTAESGQTPVVSSGDPTITMPIPVAVGATMISTEPDAGAPVVRVPEGAGAASNPDKAPDGTDPTKETLVSSPDSQPGNLIDDEQS